MTVNVRMWVPMSWKEKEPKSFLSEGEKHKDEQDEISNALDKILKKSLKPIRLPGITPDPEIPPLPTSHSLTWEQRKIDDIRSSSDSPPEEPRPVTTDSLRDFLSNQQPNLPGFGSREPPYPIYPGTKRRKHWTEYDWLSDPETSRAEHNRDRFPFLHYKSDPNKKEDKGKKKK